MKPRPRKPRARREYQPVTQDQVTDLALLPKRFDMFVSSVKDEFRLLGDKLLPTLERIEQATANHGMRLAELERKEREHDDRIAALEATRKRDVTS